MLLTPEHFGAAVTRRDVLVRAAHGFGSLALASLLDSPAGAAERVNALAPKPPHFAAKGEVGDLPVYGGRAQPGGHVRSQAGAGQIRRAAASAELRHRDQRVHQGRHAAAEESVEVQEVRAVRTRRLLAVSALAQRVDDLCFVRSFYTDSTVHAPAMYQVNTGRILMGYPSMGSWITYGLGSESENLPAYVVMPQPEGTPEGGTPCWGAGFLPAVYQGTVFRPRTEPDCESASAGGCDAGAAAAHARFSAEHERDGHAGHAIRKWRRASVPMNSRSACRAMRRKRWIIRRRTSDPQAVRTGSEAHRRSSVPAACWRGDWWNAASGSCRSIRAADRYPMQWDAHSNLVANHEKMCGMTDLPVAGLLTDLKQRGLLDSTLVIWGAEFGRLPMSQGGNGRDHNPHGFTMWFAGGGVKPGITIGETDELGLRGVGQRYPMRDFHATILQLLGLDQNRLWFLHNGRNEKLTDFGGNVIKEMLV